MFSSPRLTAVQVSTTCDANHLNEMGCRVVTTSFTRKLSAELPYKACRICVAMAGFSRRMSCQRSNLKRDTTRCAVSHTRGVAHLSIMCWQLTAEHKFLSQALNTFPRINHGCASLESMPRKPQKYIKKATKG